MDKRNVTIGQTVYLAPSDNKIRRGAPQIVEGTIITVGKKYYTIKTKYDLHREYKFGMEDLKQQTDYSPDYYLYFDKQELLDDKEAAALRKKFNRFFEWSGNRQTRLTLEQLRRINEIITEDEEQNAAND